MNYVEEMKKDLPPVFSARDGSYWLATYYDAPMKALEAMVKSELLLRLKRGVYAFNQEFDPFFAAQVLHFPSYLSFETALSHYGMIPERTHQYLSVVDGRPIKIETPVGIYSYYKQHRKLFAMGMGIELNGECNFTIATPEKALLDTLWRARLESISLENREILAYTIDGLRVDPLLLKKLSLKKLKAMASLYRNHAPRKLVLALEGWKKEKA